jgi:6-phosphogluconolactonase (cycloisomerase 2 family)
MKIRKWARLVLAVAPVLAGCKGFWDVPSGSGSGGTGTASGKFYVLNQQTSEIAGFSFAAGATSLTAVTNSPYALGAIVPFSMAMSPNGGFLYLSSAAGIFVYSVNGSTGELTLLQSGQAIAADPAFTMAVDPSGGWLVEAVSGLSQVTAIPLDPTTGLLLTGGTPQRVNLPPTATAVQQVTTTRSGGTNSYVFVAMGTQGIATIPFNASSSGNPFGTVKTISPKNSGGGDLELAVDLSRPVLYVGETAAVSGTSNTGGVRMFNIGANAALTEISGSPYATGGIGPSAILPTTNYVYVSNKTVNGSNNGNITAFAITTVGTAYSLTAVTSGTISAGVGTIGLAEDSTGTYILAVNFGGSPDLSAFTITSTGALKSYATAATGSDPVNAVSIAAP